MNCNTTHYRANSSSVPGDPTLSNFEVTQGYKDITDQTVVARFLLSEEKHEARKSKHKKNEQTSKPANQQTFVLAWTTTPWTLPGNLFLAINPSVPYVSVEHEGAHYILAADRVEAVFGDREHGKPQKIGAEDLLGRSYEPLFPYFTEHYPDAFRVVEGDFVTTDEGTGVVHIAPGFGEDDYQVGKREGAAMLQHVTMEGRFVPAVADFAGEQVKPIEDPSAMDRKIIAILEKAGWVFSTEKYKHSYPHCWRCDTPLLNYATSSWFVAVERMKEKLLGNNAKTEWVPGHIRDGRFGKWLENARDWAISRNRYWGTPLPIWRMENTGSGLSLAAEALAKAAGRGSSEPAGRKPAPTDSSALQGNEIDIIASRDDLISKHKIRFTKVTAIRHAESEGNLVPIYQGQSPGTDLTERGRAQAGDAGEFLRTQEVSVIYCSPLARARQTAAVIAEATGAQVIIDERLREVDFGEYEGKTVDFTDLSFVKARRAHKLETNQPESIYHFPGMEPWQSVQERIAGFLHEVLPRHRSDHIVIVTHADPVQNIRHFFTKLDPWKISHQPYPRFAEAQSFYWDHDRGAELDLHKDTVDDLVWHGPATGESMTVTLVRHGQTDWNLERLCQGQEGDRPLTELGKQQALETAKSLKGKNFDCIVTSDLVRAKETAAIIAKELGLPIAEESVLLRERRFGEWVGRTIADIIAEHPLALPDGEFGMHQGTPPNGESLSDFLTRVSSARIHLMEQYAGKNVLVVCHGGVIRTMRALVENLSYAEAAGIAPKNGEVTELTLSPLYRRIPEVLDCWFESGAMPYAQQHFPFRPAHRAVPVTLHSGLLSHESHEHDIGVHPLPPGFPADFIAEGIDQTRGWFYTLTVLAAALFDEPAFRHCVVNGIVLAEDGKKMSKRLQNYPEPLTVVDLHGADAVRFTLMKSTAVRGEDVRFSEKLVEESVRSMLLPLWNTYAFFVTYANAAGFQPTQTRRHSSHPLDRWIRAEVQDLVNRMTEQLEGYDLSATCAELAGTIDALTNWYVRQSRRRFAGKSEAAESSGDRGAGEQHDALSTLYDVLLTLSQALAPFCPYITDAIYLNLVSEEHGSIHLTDWPEVRTLTSEEKQLIERTRVLRTAASLGQRIRSAANVKIRQPLARATIALPPALREGLAFSEEDLTLLRQELNVKEISFADDPAGLAEVIVLVNARKAGPVLGARVQEVIAAGKRGEFEQREDGSVKILDVELSPDMVEIQYRGAEGTDVAADHGIVVSLDTVVSETLASEGNARDLIRAVQQLRKDAGLQFTDRIRLQVQGADDMLAAHADLITEELRAEFAENKGDPHVLEIEDRKMTVRFEKI